MLDLVSSLFSSLSREVSLPCAKIKTTGTVSVKYLPCILQLTYPNANPKHLPPPPSPLSKVRVRVSYIFDSDLLLMTCRLELPVEGSMGTKFHLVKIMTLNHSLQGKS